MDLKFDISVAGVFWQLSKFQIMILSTVVWL